MGRTTKSTRNNPDSYLPLPVGFMCPACGKRLDAISTYYEMDKFSRMLELDKLYFLNTKFQHKCNSLDVITYMEGDEIESPWGVCRVIGLDDTKENVVLKEGYEADEEDDFTVTVSEFLQMIGFTQMIKGIGGR